ESATRASCYDLPCSPSRIPSLKFLTELPRPLARLGNRLAPKIRTTINRMMMSSGSPSVPNIGGTPRNCAPVDCGDCTTSVRAVRAAAQFSSGVSLVEVSDRRRRPNDRRRRVQARHGDPYDVITKSSHLPVTARRGAFQVLRANDTSHLNDTR